MAFTRDSSLFFPSSNFSSSLLTSEVLLEKNCKYFMIIMIIFFIEYIGAKAVKLNGTVLIADQFNSRWNFVNCMSHG